MTMSYTVITLRQYKKMYFLFREQTVVVFGL